MPATGGDLDVDDSAVNDHAAHRRDGRILSRYPIPDELTDPDDDDDAVWVMTDDLADADPLTTILWPSDY